MYSVIGPPSTLVSKTSAAAAERGTGWLGCPVAFWSERDAATVWPSANGTRSASRRASMPM